MADGVARRYVLWPVIKEAASASACICPAPISWGRGSKGWQELQIGGGRGRMQQTYAAGKGGHEELLLVFRQLVIQNTAYEWLQIKYLNDAKAKWTHSYSILNDIRTIIIIHEDNYQNNEKCSEFEKRSNWLMLQPVSLILMLDGRKKDHYRILICFWKDTGNPHKN